MVTIVVTWVYRLGHATQGKVGRWKKKRKTLKPFIARCTRGFFFLRQWGIWCRESAFVVAHAMHLLFSDPGYTHIFVVFDVVADAPCSGSVRLRKKQKKKTKFLLPCANFTNKNRSINIQKNPKLVLRFFLYLQIFPKFYLDFYQTWLSTFFNFLCLIFFST